MAQSTDFTIANQSFPSFRSDLNDVLESINTSNSGVQDLQVLYRVHFG